MGCDPSDPCDTGYYEDHGGCYPFDASPPTNPDDQDSGTDGPGGNPNATFGTKCNNDSDCSEVAPSCGAPMFPVCTAINCHAQAVNPCPATWTCLDVTAYSPDPTVTTVCVQL